MINYTLQATFELSSYSFYFWCKNLKNQQINLKIYKGLLLPKTKKKCFGVPLFLMFKHHDKKFIKYIDFPIIL